MDNVINYKLKDEEINKITKKTDTSPIEASNSAKLYDLNAYKKQKEDIKRKLNLAKQSEKDKINTNKEIDIAIPCPLRKRLFAFFIDVIFICLPFALDRIIYGDGNFNFFMTFFSATAVYLLEIYFWENGQTVGKFYMNIQVVNSKNNEVFDFSMMFIRTFIGKMMLGFLSFGLGYFFVFLNKKNKSIHDIVCNSMVVDIIN